MKFHYMVNHDGVYYPAGVDVPIKDPPDVNEELSTSDKDAEVDETKKGEPVTENDKPVKRGRPAKDKE